MTALCLNCNTWDLFKPWHTAFFLWHVGSSFQFSSAQSCLTFCDPMNHSMPGLPVQHQLPVQYQSLHKLMSIESVMPSNHLILCHSLLFLPSTFPSVRVFSNESAVFIRWLNYWSFIFSISHSNEHPGLISFRMGWLNLLAVQGTLKSLLQNQNWKASVIRHSRIHTWLLGKP